MGIKTKADRAKGERERKQPNKKTLGRQGMKEGDKNESETDGEEREADRGEH